MDTVHRQLFQDTPWVSEDADPMPITDDQVAVLTSWYWRLNRAIHEAQQIDDVAAAYGHIQGACVDVEVEIMHVLGHHGIDIMKASVPTQAATG